MHCEYTRTHFHLTHFGCYIRSLSKYNTQRKHFMNAHHPNMLYVYFECLYYAIQCYTIPPLAMIVL
ncbi:hypothetical protein HanIR_Chr05g0235271 [Helianthus annuus]|nr:hypothetical protein HanIR_Chr05g0235271 [Helianthus annuus]